MAILFSADFHGNKDKASSIEVSKKKLCSKYTKELFKEIKYHIILGDGYFPIDEKDWFCYKSLANRPFPILCVIGNHEKFSDINDLQKFEEDAELGETVFKIKKNKPYVAYLKKGKVYNIDGIRFLVLGGGLSIKKDNNIEELQFIQGNWSKQEEQDLFKLLETENEFDYVLSHTGPHRVNEILFKEKVATFCGAIDIVAEMNDKIDKNIKCCGWLCGHWHRNDHHYEKDTNRHYYYLNKVTTIILSKEKNELKIHKEIGNNFF
jgi:hypothetical protein